jgi:hypothetical protein
MGKIYSYLRQIVSIFLVSIFLLSFIYIPPHTMFAITSSNPYLYTEPLNYTLVFLHPNITKEYIYSHCEYKYSECIISKEKGWVIMNSTNYTFIYFGKSCRDNYTFDSICLRNVTYRPYSYVVTENFYNVTIISIPTSNGMDSVIKISHKYTIIRGISPESTWISNEFYWYNYTKKPLGDNLYNVTFNGNVEGVKTKGFIVEDPNNAKITLVSGLINIVYGSTIANATINNNKVTMYINNTDPITFDPIVIPCVYYYPCGYAVLASILSTLPEGDVTGVAHAIEYISLILGEIASAVVPCIGLLVALLTTYISMYAVILAVSRKPLARMVDPKSYYEK